MGYDPDFYLGVDDRVRGWLFLGLALLTFVVDFVGHWALATYYPTDYDTGTIVILVIVAIEIVGLYAAFRFYQLRHPQ